MTPQVGKVCTWTKWHQVTRTITTLPLHGMPVRCKVTPPAFNQASLKIFSNQFVLLGKTQHCESKVSCPRTQHKQWSLSHNPTPWSQTQNPASPWLFSKHLQANENNSPQYSFMHVLCNNLIINLNPQLTGPCGCRPPELHKEKTVCMATASNIDQLHLYGWFFGVLFNQC